MQLRRFIGGLLVGLMLLSAAPTFAAGPLDLIPENASVVVRLKNPEATLGKVVGYVNAGAPGFGIVVASQISQLGVAISNTTLGGVDMRKDWYIAVFVQKNAAPAIAFIIPTNDEEALKEAVGSNFTFVTSGSWVAYSEESAATELIEQCKAGKSKPIAMEKRSGLLCEESDLSIFVNAAKLREIYAEELVQADKQIDDGIEALKALTEGAAAQAPGINLGAIFEMYGRAGHHLLQGVRDSDAFTIGVKVSNDALTIDELLVIAADSQTDKVLQVNQPNELTVLSKLPQNRLGYFAVHGDMQGMIEWSIQSSLSFFEGNEELQKKVKTLVGEMKDIKLGAIGGTFSLNPPSDEGVVSGVFVTEVTPTDKWRSLSRRMSQDLKLDLPGVKQEITIKENVEKHGDSTVDLVNFKQEIDENAPGATEQKLIMDVAYGKNGMTQRLSSTKTHAVQTIGGGSDEMKGALAAIDQINSTPNAVSKSRARQLAKANVLGMIDLPNTALKVALVWSELASKGTVPPPQIPLPEKQLKALKVDPSFITFAIGTEPQGLRIRTEVPSGTIAGFFKIFNAVQQGGRAARPAN